MELFYKAITRYILGVIIVGCLLFIPANTIKYWNAWLFMGLLFIPMLLAGIILIIKNPKLLNERLDVKEKETEQKKVILFSGLMFLLGFTLAGLNYRFKWFLMPNSIIIISSILFGLAYMLYAEVLRENAYLSRTIKVQEDQKVIEIISFVIFIAYPFIIAKRIINEEKILKKELKGYKEYKKKVKYRLIPFVW